MRISTCPWVAIFTTAGVTFSSMGARLGNGLPSTAAGKSAWALRMAAAAKINTIMPATSQTGIFKGEAFAATEGIPR